MKQSTKAWQIQRSRNNRMLWSTISRLSFSGWCTRILIASRRKRNSISRSWSASVDRRWKISAKESSIHSLVMSWKSVLYTLISPKKSVFRWPKSTMSCTFFSWKNGSSSATRSRSLVRFFRLQFVAYDHYNQENALVVQNFFQVDFE